LHRGGSVPEILPGRILSAGGKRNEQEWLQPQVGVSAFFRSDLAIDLGTANTLVVRARQGIVVNRAVIGPINKSIGESSPSAAKQRYAGPHAGERRGHQAMKDA